MKKKLLALLLCVGMFAEAAIPLLANSPSDMIIESDYGETEKSIAVETDSEETNTHDFLVPVEQKTEVPEGYIGIYTAQDLDNVRNDLDANYILMNDIDLSAYENWVPIGDSVAEGFVGTFDGNGHSIANLRIDDTYLKTRRFGLFSKIYSSNIYDLKVTDAHISIKNSAAYVGVISAAMENSNVDNCCVSGKIIDESGHTTIGGIIGEQFDVWSGNKKSVIKNCFSSCDMIGLTLGGIVGYISPYHMYYAEYSYSTLISIENCHSEGYLYGENVGGIIGQILLQNSVPSIDINIQHCGSTADIFGVDSNAGGIVAKILGGGLSDGKAERFINISECYSNCSFNLASTGGTIVAGGIVGQIQNSNGTKVEISDTYSVANIYCELVSQESYAISPRIGGIIGEYSFPDSSYAANMTINTINKAYSFLSVSINSDYNEYSYLGHAIGSICNSMSQKEIKCVISSCFKPISQYEFVGTNTGTGLPATIILSDCIALSDAEMQSASSFVGFDFDTVWEIGVTEGYPYPTLRNNPHNPGDEKNAPDIPDDAVYYKGTSKN